MSGTTDSTPDRIQPTDPAAAVVETERCRNSDSAGSPPPFWVAFPIHALPQTNWSDHSAAHRAVMKLFPPRLPGPEGERRSAAGVLYRLDPQPDGGVHCLVQTRHAIEVLPPAARALTVPDAAWNIPNGQRMMIRVTVNPVTRRTVKEPARRRREVTGLVAFNDVMPWLTSRIGHAITDCSVLDHTRTITRAKSRDRSGPPEIVMDTLDLVGVVGDAEELKRLRLEGVGRARAYGCGLLTALPVHSGGDGI